MTLWIEWSIIDGNRSAFYIWNNLPDPTGTGRRFGFPNTTFLEYAGDGKFSFEGDYYNPADAERVVGEWLRPAVAERDTPKDRSPRRASTDGPRCRADAAASPRGGRGRVRNATSGVAASPWPPATGTSGPTSSPTTPTTASTTTATSRSVQIREWIKRVMQPFPTMEFPVVVAPDRRQPCHRALIPNILPAARGRRRRTTASTSTRSSTTPADGKWSYEEDVYSPEEAQEVVGRLGRRRRCDPVGLTGQPRLRGLLSVGEQRGPLLRRDVEVGGGDAGRVDEHRPCDLVGCEVVAVGVVEQGLQATPRLVERVVAGRRVRHRRVACGELDADGRPAVGRPSLRSKTSTGKFDSRPPSTHVAVPAA